MKTVSYRPTRSLPTSGATLIETSLVVALLLAGRVMDTTCPSGGTHSWTGSIPAIGSSHVSCDFTDPDGVTTHVLAASDTKDS